MKRTLIGGFLALVGSIWALAALLAGGAYVDQVASWYSPPGRYGTALIESNMMIPLVVGGILLVLGLVILGVEYFKKEG